MSSAASPFRSLEPCRQGDAGFCGRADETERLYRQLMTSQLVLVYGLSGTGKTSLIQCGLSRKLRQDVDWLPVWVRRGADINSAWRTALAAAAGIDPAPAAIVDAVREAFRATLLPVYLILDQFEELLLLGSAAEQAAFFADLQALLASDANVRVIISLREEYVGALTPFEAMVPELFDRRLRLAPMDPPRLAGMIGELLAIHNVGLEGGDATATAIAARLGGGNFQLAHLQLYLDQLYRDAPERDGRRTIMAAQVADSGGLGAIIMRLLQEQLAAADAAAAAAAPGAPVAGQLMDRLVTLEGTKRPRTRGELALAGVAEAAIDAALAALVAGRLLRVVDDRYELGHDWLAAEIAELRSTEQRQLAVYRRIVAEGCTKQAGDFPNAWLSREEVALIRPVADRLELDAAQAAYLEKSHRIRRRQRAGVIGGTVAVIAVLTGLLGLTVQARNAAQATVQKSTEAAFGVVDEINGFLVRFPGTGQARIGLVDSSISLIENLHGGSVPVSDRDWRYPSLLLQRARTLFENGEPALAREQLDVATARIDQQLRQQPGNQTWRALQSRARSQRVDLISSVRQKRDQALQVLATNNSVPAFYNVAEKDIQLGDAAHARQMLEQGLAQTQGLPPNPYSTMLLQFGFGNLALLEQRKPAAMAAFEQASAAGVQVLDQQPDANYTYYAVAAQCQLGHVQRQLGQQAASACTLRRARALLQRLDQTPSGDLAEIIGQCRAVPADALQCTDAGQD